MSSASPHPKRVYATNTSSTSLLADTSIEMLVSTPSSGKKSPIKKVLSIPSGSTKTSSGHSASAVFLRWLHCYQPYAQPPPIEFLSDDKVKELIKPDRKEE